ncbi:MAG: preprotein translocase subunit SecA [Bacillota bacterium]
MQKLFGDSNEREVRRLWKVVEQVNALEPEMQSLADTDFPRRSEQLKERLRQGAALDDLLPEAFAVAREAARRSVGMRPFDVQVLGGIVLHQGRIAEMKTGEGKTLVATMPAYLNALTGKGVHIVTVNDYLARRDSEWMGPVYRMLGLAVGLVVHGVDQEQRRKAYRSDIVYATNNELGFDYLRDNMVLYKEELVQRELHYAIVDEVDSILIDEARTPLIISSRVESKEEYSRWRGEVETLIRKQNRMVNDLLTEAQVNLEQGHREAVAEQLLLARRGAPKNKKLLKLLKTPGLEKLVERTKQVLNAEKRLNHLDEELYFVIDETTRIADIKDKGYRELERVNPEVSRLLKLGRDKADDLADEKEEQEAGEHRHYFDQLLKAYSLYERDVDYVVQDGKVIIVDEFTGRLMWGRRYSDGLHQAIEAKEKVEVQSDTRTVASITFQNYFRMYDKLSGMTGTAATEEEEFRKIYGMDVVGIPTNKVLIRQELRDMIYKTDRAKFKAAVEEIQRRSETGQPVLVGTISVEKSEMLSKMLKRQGIRHEVLNAVNHNREAFIIAQAGRKGAVTISTNMAGRGTDIVLGGNPDYLVEDQLNREFGDDAAKGNPGKQQQVTERRKVLLEKANREAARERDDVISLGGLHVLGTERHESRRIDNQLRGRAGRQGDPGSSQFFVSLDDDLMRLFGGDNVASLMDRFGMEEDMPIEHGLISGVIERAQKKVESRNFEIRRHLLEYDDVLNQQRTVIYAQRRRVLEGEDMRQPILEMVEEVIDRLLQEHFGDHSYLEEEQNRALLALGEAAFLRRGRISSADLADLEPAEARRLLLDEALQFYNAREEELSSEIMRELERVVLLRTVDRHWMYFIDVMHQLRHEIYLRAYGQKDPLVEYRLESANMWEDMIRQIQEDVVRGVYQLKVVAPPRRQAVTGPATGVRPRVAPVGEGSSAAPASQSTSQAPRQAPQPVTVEKTGRNEPCPCGSGKKYKKCCGA